MLTTKVRQIVMDNNGIKCDDITKALNASYKSISGILSALKLRGFVINTDGLWHAISETPAVKYVKLRLLEINDDGIDMFWCEGYLSALADRKYITESEFELLMNWIKTMED